MTTKTSVPAIAHCSPQGNYELCIMNYELNSCDGVHQDGKYTEYHHYTEDNAYNAYDQFSFFEHLYHLRFYCVLLL